MTEDIDIKEKEEVLHVKKLVDGAQNSNMDAFGQLYDLYLPKIYRYCTARIRNIPEAEDLAEEIFVKVLTNIHKFQWSQSIGGANPFTSWLFRIAHNHVVSFTRKLSTKTQTSELGEWIPDKEPTPSQEVELQLSIDEVFTAVQKLPTAQRDVIMMRFSAGLSIAETAASLDKKESNVKVLQHKAVTSLKKMLQDDQGLISKELIL